MGVCVYTNFSAQAGYDTRSIFTLLNSEISFSQIGGQTKVKKRNPPYY